MRSSNFKFFLFIFSINLFFQKNALAESVHDKALRYLHNNEALTSCNVVVEELDLVPDFCEDVNDPSVADKINKNSSSLALLQPLGISLRQLGATNNALIVLQIAQKIETGNEDNILLSIGNVYQEKYINYLDQSRFSQNMTTVIESRKNAILMANQALEIYTGLSKSEDKILRLTSQLNWLLLILSLPYEIPELNHVQAQALDGINSYVKNLNNDINSSDIISFSRRSALRLKLVAALKNQIGKEYDDLIFNNLKQVIEDSRVNRDWSSESSAYLLLGDFYYQKRLYSSSISELSKGLSIAESNRSADQIYQFRWKLGKIYNHLGNNESAIANYSNAVSALDYVRNNILSISTNKQFLFLNEVEPLYKEYLEILFTQAQPDYKKIIELFENLQVKEIENYLQCGKNIKINSLTKLSYKDSPDSMLFVIELPNFYGYIVRDKSGEFKSKLTKKDNISLRLKTLYRNLDSTDLSRYNITTFQKIFHSLYLSIFNPIESLLPNTGTLLLSLDRKLQKLPWSVIYDGNQYLIERYNIVYSLGTEKLRNNLKNYVPKILAAGISQQTNDSSYPPLPQVAIEIDAIKNIFSTKALLNSRFTKSKLVQENQNFPFIHIASHGQFSSNPKRTYILSWNQKIYSTDLANLIRARNYNLLDLLVLSACETAKGDARATLGIAGTAIQSGARSTLASLWVVNDSSQAELIGKFYSELKAGKSKSIALQEAQLSLLRSKNFNNPYYWGSPILVGDWN